MDAIRVTLEPNQDGTLHLSLPEGLRHGMLKVTATIERVEDAAPGTPGLWGFGRLKGKLTIVPRARRWRCRRR